MEKEINKLFVHFELSVRLKEKDFNEPCFGYYENQDEKLIIDYSNQTSSHPEAKKRPKMFEIDNTNKALPQWATSAPTHQQVIDWLREVKQLFIEIHTDCTSYPKYCYTIHRFIGNPKDLSEREWDWETNI